MTQALNERSGFAGREHKHSDRLGVGDRRQPTVADKTTLSKGTPWH